MKKLLIVFMVTTIQFATSAQLIALEKNYYCPPCSSDCDELVFDEAGTCNHCSMTLQLQTREERSSVMNRKRTTIAFYLQDGVEVLDFAGPMEVFAYAGFKVFTVSKTQAPITSQGILKIIPDYSIKNAPKADILAFFGGNASSAADDSEVIEWINSRKAKTEYFFSVCTGAFILGEAALLDNQTVTTFHLSIENLTKSFPKAKVLSDVRFVDNGHVITTAGISAGIDGALHLVQKLRGKEAAIQAAKYMEYDKWIPEEGLILSKKD